MSYFTISKKNFGQKFHLYSGPYRDVIKKDSRCKIWIIFKVARNKRDHAKAVDA